MQNVTCNARAAIWITMSLTQLEGLVYFWRTLSNSWSVRERIEASDWGGWLQEAKENRSLRSSRMEGGFL